MKMHARMHLRSGELDYEAQLHNITSARKTNQEE